MKKLSREEVINRFIKYRGNEQFDYSFVNYVNRRTSVTILCKKHNNYFTTFTEEFVSGHKIGCEECRKESYRNKRGFSQEDIINKFKEIHKNEYNYSKVKYINIDTPVKIICNKCNSEFSQTPFEHLYGNKRKGSGCPYCYDHLPWSHEHFLKELKKLNINYFEILSKFNGFKNPLKIRCLKCNKIYFSEPQNILNFHKCSCSIKYKGNEKIYNFLKYYNISYIPEYSIKGLKYKKALRFDAYLNNLNIAIEYDGIEHFEPRDFGEKNYNKVLKNFEETKIRDNIKNEFCKNNNIKLIRIPYWDYENIENILLEELCLEKK